MRKEKSVHITQSNLHRTAGEKENATQKEVAELIGVPKNSYNNWENGREPSFAVLQKIGELMINEKAILSTLKERMIETGRCVPTDRINYVEHTEHWNLYR